MALKVGTKAPDFTLPSTAGYQFNLSRDFRGKACIIYFFPKDFTPGCNTQACGFRDQYEEFLDLDIEIIGISRDTIETHERFKKQFNLPFDFLSDTTGKVVKDYEALIPVINMPRRLTYLLDDQHIIRASYENMFGARKHIEEMLRQKSLFGFTQSDK